MLRAKKKIRFCSSQLKIVILNDSVIKTAINIARFKIVLQKSPKKISKHSYIQQIDNVISFAHIVVTSEHQNFESFENCSNRFSFEAAVSKYMYAYACDCNVFYFFTLAAKRRSAFAIVGVKVLRHNWNRKT